MPHDLDRFLAAQQGAYAGALEELRQGRKTGHWIWFVFPQLAGLGRSEMSRYYAITSLDEARAYLVHPVLGARLRECATAVLATNGRTAVEIFGSVDAVKVRSCMTLFRRAAPDDPVFATILDRFYERRPDETTDALLGSSSAGA
ncbi:MAG TPA: DUF1810 domain-containing protein [Candidatus Limnocylindrales bacterium]